MAPFHDECWTRTALGTPVALWASAPLDTLADARPILLFGGVHGDEPEGARLADDTRGYLAARAGDPAITPWVVIPCLNPDGLARGTRVNGRGVDLNRNYPSSDWSPVAELPRYFPGPSPASEPEVQGIVALIDALRPRLLIHCHSWRPCIVQTGAPGRRDAERLAASVGSEIVDDVGYPTPGSLSRYGWHDRGIPVVCIEDQDEQTDLATIWPRFARGIEEIFHDPSLREAAHRSK